jgi:hypothetical protein
VPTCYIGTMNSSEVLETLRRSEAALRAAGCDVLPCSARSRGATTSPTATSTLWSRLIRPPALPYSSILASRNTSRACLTARSMWSAATISSRMSARPRQPMRFMPSKRVGWVAALRSPSPCARSLPPFAEKKLPGSYDEQSPREDISIIATQRNAAHRCARPILRADHFYE